ncbi:signal peptide peptidase-domain-containing protein [Amylocarpus encephaloides]|uniref:Signal peptide peptidase-domain-containing protein n=1 Tax=Amylocarpus encephaloides TaxID=45428 RepID=A0A9P7Y7A0_9HELO|nr:signal peptide peptidase-domain-containing protein [Amylocarpus encephaloides]
MDNSTAFSSIGTSLQYVGRWAYKIYDEWDMIQMHIHLILAALFPIYIGSHAALRRPPSAKHPAKSSISLDAEDDGLERDEVVEGLTPSDAILFPVLAGTTLGGLYFIIKWMEDPALLNKILTWYFSCLGIFGVGKLAADALNVLDTFVFPTVWANSKQEFSIEQNSRKQISRAFDEPRNEQTRCIVASKTNPLAGPFSKLRLPRPITESLWSLRAILRRHWVFRSYIRGILSLSSRVKMNDVIGLLIGVAAIAVYNLGGKSWWLTNLMGFGFAYGTFQLMSPTTFWTGSLVLAGLFIYDIVMVFYTPLMVTVATSLEVPIKLVFPGPKRGAMLGLGDVVLPGIMMALALRFDLYLFYLRKQQPNAVVLNPKDLNFQRATYLRSTGVWGELFWTRLAPAEATPIEVKGARFSKVYFYASVVGYVIGMFATLIVLRVFNHAQPALLYLVPGVLISLWGTAFLRGEFDLMWEYTEDGSLDFYEKSDGGGKPIENGEVNEKKPKEPRDHHVFMFSLSEPRKT